MYYTRHSPHPYPVGSYPYIGDLQGLTARRPCQSVRPLEQKGRGVSTPLQIKAWKQALAHHPDPAFQHYIIEGLSEGFRIGFDRRQPLQSARKNMPSAAQHHKSPRTLPGSDGEPQPNIHINRFGVIPKGHTPGKCRLITDLSFPPECSVNDGIDLTLCSLSYVSVDTVAAAAAAFGP